MAMLVIVIKVKPSSQRRLIRTLFIPDVVPSVQNITERFVQALLYDWITLLILELTKPLFFPVKLLVPK